jgi:tight adherence protein C
MTELLALFSSAGLGIAVTCSLLLLIWLLALLKRASNSVMRQSG